MKQQPHWAFAWVPVVAPSEKMTMMQAVMAQHRNLPETASVAQDLLDGRLSAPAAERNAQAITGQLCRFAPAVGQALEIASGTGQHIVCFARATPGLIWQPTEIDPTRLASIEIWRTEEDLPNLRPARALDATAKGWGADRAGQSLIVLINLLHLISTAETQTLIDETAQALAPGGRFLLYGPFLRDGRATSDGDARFDASLRASDPDIGYKDLVDVQQWLADTGLHLLQTIDMPANNLILISERRTETP